MPISPAGDLERPLGSGTHFLTLEVIDVHIDWVELELAFDRSDVERAYYLDRETGQVVADFDEDGNELDELDPDRYVLIEPPDSHERWRWMSGFIETVRDEHLADLLAIALEGRGAFRRFKDVLTRDPAERERWFEFEDGRMRCAIREWLCDNDIHPDDPPDWARPEKVGGAEGGPGPDR